MSTDLENVLKNCLLNLGKDKKEKEKEKEKEKKKKKKKEKEEKKEKKEKKEREQKAVELHYLSPKAMREAVYPPGKWLACQRSFA